MALRIDYFFKPVSGYAYLGHDALAALAAAHGATVVPRPMDVAAVFEAVGVTPPPRQHPARLRYRRTDMARWARHRRLPLVVEPRFWPTDGTLASLCIVAAALHGADPMRLSGALLSAVWTRDLDVADPDTVAGLIAECGLDAAAIMATARGDAARTRFTENTWEAIDRGALGSPTMVVGDTMIFGQDRLPFLIDVLEGGSQDPVATREAAS